MFGEKLYVGRREDLFFFGLHPIIGGTLDVGSVKTFFFFFFFGLHLRFGEKLDVGRREGLVEMCLTVAFKF